MSFKQLEDENIQGFKASNQAPKIEQRINGTLNMFRFVGNIFDLYLTRLKDALIEMGKEEEQNVPTIIPPDKEHEVQ